MCLFRQKKQPGFYTPTAAQRVDTSTALNKKSVELTDVGKTASIEYGSKPSLSQTTRRQGAKELAINLDDTGQRQPEAERGGMNIA